MSRHLGSQASPSALPSAGLPTALAHGSLDGASLRNPKNVLLPLAPAGRQPAELPRWLRLVPEKTASGFQLESACENSCTGCASRRVPGLMATVTVE